MIHENFARRETYKRLGRVVVPGASWLTNRLLVSGQRGLRHGARVTGTGLWQVPCRRHRWSPCGRVSATLHRQFDVISRTHDHILRILVPQIVHIDAVHLHDRIASVETSLVSQTASVHLNEERIYVVTGL